MSANEVIALPQDLLLVPGVSLDLVRGPGQTTSASPQGEGLEGYDEEQIAYMTDEWCIVVDEKDLPIGSATKEICHRMVNIDKGLLHRAFSVFLFDSNWRLLLQQRASEKITFPDMWTNTCCSHPLAVASEFGADLETGIKGARNAAQRKLDHELGIKAAQVPLDKFNYLTRIHYKAPSDGEWGEHEIDYILFIQADVDLDVNKSEARDTRYVGPEELKNMLEDPSLKFTPWFERICRSGKLFTWWDNYRLPTSEKFTDSAIHGL